MSTAQEFFKAPSNLRTFCIHTSTDNIYINIYYMAEFSEFFNVMCNGEFREKNEMEATMPDVTANDLIQFVAYVCPVNFQLEQSITAKNIHNLIYFSDRLICPFVKSKLKQWFVAEDFKRQSFTPEELVDLVILLNSQNYSINEMGPVFKRIAVMDSELVKKSLEGIEEEVKKFLEEKIRLYTPYQYQRKPGGTAWGDYDYRARIFF